MIQIVKGDLLQAKEDILGHQVNTMGVMGAGLAKQIKEKYPSVYQKYCKVCETDDKQSLMGKVQLCNIDNDKKIANLFGQMSIGRHKVQTDYKSLQNALETLKAYAMINNKTVALPMFIGCGLAGGDWQVVSKMIEDVFSDYAVTLYEYV